MDRANMQILIPASAKDGSTVVLNDGSLYTQGSYLEPSQRYSAKVIPEGIATSEAALGFVEYTTEATTNKAGVRRVLVRVDVPYLPADTATTQACCCRSAEEARASGVPVVSAHVVLTVPAEVAADAATKAYPKQLPDAVLDLLVQAIGSLKRAAKPAMGKLVPNAGYVTLLDPTDEGTATLKVLARTWGSDGVIHTPAAPYSVFPELVSGVASLPQEQDFVE